MTPHRRVSFASRAALRAAACTCAVAAALAALPARADADGPDYYRVRNVAAGHTLALRAEPSTSSRKIARIPADAACLRNLGCRGGLTFEEFTTLSDEQKRRRAQENPRWCKVDFEGAVGWVDGRYVAEGPPCAAAVTPSR